MRNFFVRLWKKLCSFNQLMIDAPSGGKVEIDTERRKMMKSISELEQIRQDTFNEIKMRIGEKIDTNRKNILVCGGTGCTSSKSPKIVEELEREIKERNLENEVHVIKTGCFGLCAKGPIMIVYPGEIFYAMVKPENTERINEEDCQDLYSEIEVANNRKSYSQRKCC